MSTNKSYDGDCAISFACFRLKKVSNYRGTCDYEVGVADFFPLSHTILTGLGIPTGTRLYPCPTHEQSGRVWAPPMDTKAYPNPIHSGRISMGIHVHG